MPERKETIKPINALNIWPTLQQRDQFHSAQELVCYFIKINYRLKAYFEVLVLHNMHYEKHNFSLFMLHNVHDEMLDLNENLTLHNKHFQTYVLKC